MSKSPPPPELPGDSLNFSFSPSSPPTFPAFPSSTAPFSFFDSPIPPGPSSQSEHDEDDEEDQVEEMDADGPDYRKAVKDEDRLRRGPPTADKPGGDCKQLCIRHQRMANGGTNLMLQKSIENLPPADQEIVNSVWSLFSSSPARRRLLILRGLLTIACPSQLTFLQDALTLEMRLDPIEILPREVTLKIFGYLDAISLGRAAQVSKSWKALADDDILWRTMCEQHIERKCEKCGWGLPLLGERRRKARQAKEQRERERVEREGERERTTTTSSTGSSITADLWQYPPRSRAPSQSGNATASTSMALDTPRPCKRTKTHSPSSSRPSTPIPTSPRTQSRSSTRSSSSSAAPGPSAATTRPWKQVYCERLAIERNWRRGTHSASTLAGHQDSITCLQVAEDLPHPNFPLLMTGSWDRTVRIWNLETSREVGVIRGHTRGVRALQFDAAKLITGSMDASLKIWNWRTGECLRTLNGHADAVLCLTYDRQLLVSGSADHTIRVWDFGTGEVYALRGHTEWVNSVALWDANIGAANASHDGDFGRPINDPNVARETNGGKFLFSASDDATIRVWNLYTRECVRVLRGHVAQVQSLRVVKADSGEPLSQPTPNVNTPDASDFFGGAASGPICAAGTPAGPSASYRAAAALLAPSSSMQPLLPLAGDKKPLVISASLDNTIKVWDVDTGLCERTMFGHIEGVWDVDVDKLRIVSGSHDRTLKIWDKESGRNLHTLVGHTGAVTAITLQDAYVVSGGDDGTVRLWRFS